MSTIARDDWHSYTLFVNFLWHHRDVDTRCCACELLTNEWHHWAVTILSRLLMTVLAWVAYIVHSSVWLLTWFVCSSFLREVCHTVLLPTTRVLYKAHGSLHTPIHGHYNNFSSDTASLTLRTTTGSRALTFRAFSGA